MTQPDMTSPTLLATTSAPSLYDAAAKNIVLKQPFTDLAVLPATVRFHVARMRSHLEFAHRYASFEEIPLVFHRDGSVNMARTVQKAESTLQALELFELCCVTGQLTKLADIWEQCHGFGQDDLLHHSCFFFRFFAEKIHSGRVNPFFSNKRMFAYARKHKWNTVAVQFYKQLKVEDRKSFLIDQWMATAKTERPFEKALEAALLRELIALKDFDIEESELDAVADCRALYGIGAIMEIDRLMKKSSRVQVEEVRLPTVASHKLNSDLRLLHKLYALFLLIW